MGPLGAGLVGREGQHDGEGVQAECFTIPFLDEDCGSPVEVVLTNFDSVIARSMRFSSPLESTVAVSWCLPRGSAIFEMVANAWLALRLRPHLPSQWSRNHAVSRPTDLCGE